MLKIDNLHATVAEKAILNGLTLELNAVEAQKLLDISLEGSVA